MRKILILLGFLAFAGCDSLPENETYQPATFKLVNSSSYDIYRLYLGSCEALTYGEDQLGTEIVPVGKDFTLTGVPLGCYWLYADTNTDIYWESDGPVNIRGGLTWIVR